MRKPHEPTTRLRPRSLRDLLTLAVVEETSSVSSQSPSLAIVFSRCTLATFGPDSKTRSFHTRCAGRIGKLASQSYGNVPEHSSSQGDRRDGGHCGVRHE